MPRTLLCNQMHDGRLQTKMCMRSHTKIKQYFPLKLAFLRCMSRVMHEKSTNIYIIFFSRSLEMYASDNISDNFF